MKTARHTLRPRRSGVALVYVAIIVGAMMGVASLAVDLGRYAVVHSQLYNASMAAARAGAESLSTSTSAATTAATTVATLNKVDGQSITSGMVSVDFINWTSSSSYTVLTSAYTGANAVRVRISYSVPLTFAQALGLTSKTAYEHSTAQVVISTDTPTVYATGDIWLANEPAGTHASQADPNYTTLHGTEDHQYPYDIAGTPGTRAGGATSYAAGQPYSSPIKVGFNVTPGATITITNCSGSTSYDHDTSSYLDATANGGVTWVCHNYAANNVAEHGISDATMPIGSMNAVFTGTAVPDNIATTPPCLDFTGQTARDYVGLQPKLQQAFYVGDGKTSGGTQQQIVVPQGATYFFLGIMDAWEWDNNNGSINCTVTQIYVTTVE